MLTLRGTHNGEAYEVEISTSSTSDPEYQCRVTRGNGSEKRLKVELISRAGARWTFRIDGKIQDLVISRHDAELLVDWNNRNYRLYLTNAKDVHSPASADHPVHQDAIRAEMTGKVVTVNKKEGDPVTAKECLATIEAMKMLNQIASPKDGTIKKSHVQPGSVVKPGDLLFEIE